MRGDEVLPSRPASSVRALKLVPPLVELFAAAVIGLVLLLSTAIRVVWLVVPRCRGSPIEDARTDAMAVRSAVELYVAQSPGGPCPTMADLTRERILSTSTRTDDPWGEPFRITCVADEIVVWSTGPDRRPGTADDVR